MGFQLASLFVDISARGMGSVTSVLDTIGAKLHDTVDAAMDAELQFAKLSKVTGLTGGAMGELRNQLFGLASSMNGVKLGELSGIATMGSRMGVASKDLAGFTRDIATMSAALQDIPVETAATGVARLLTIFGRGTGDTLRMASAMNRLDVESSATAEELIGMAQRMGGHANLLGITAQQTLALAAALRDVGVEALPGATAIDQVFMKMATSSEGFAKVAGVSLGKFVGALRTDAMGALELFMTGLKRFKPTEALEALDSLGFKGRLTAGTILQLSSVMDKVADFTGKANDEWRTMDSVQKGAAIHAGTTAAQFDRLNNVLQISAVKFGTALLPVVKATVGAFARLGDGVGRFLDRNKATIESWSAWLAGKARYIDTAFAEWPLTFAYATAQVKEKAGQVVEVFNRLGAALKKGAVWGFESGVTVLKNRFADLFRFVADLFRQTVDSGLANLSIGIRSLVRDMLPTLTKFGLGGKAMEINFGKDRDPVDEGVKPDFGLFGDPTRGVKPPPALDLMRLLAKLPETGEVGKAAKKLRDAMERRAKAEEARAKEALGEGGAPGGGKPDGHGDLDFDFDDEKKRRSHDGGLFTDPMSFYRQLQESVFGGDPALRTAKATEETARLLRARLAKNTPAPPGFANMALGPMMGIGQLFQNMGGVGPAIPGMGGPAAVPVPPPRRGAPPVMKDPFALPPAVLAKRAAAAAKADAAKKARDAAKAAKADRARRFVKPARPLPKGGMIRGPKPPVGPPKPPGLAFATTPPGMDRVKDSGLATREIVQPLDQVVALLTDLLSTTKAQKPGPGYAV